MNLLKTFASDDSGATLIEYGLIVALVAVAAIGAMQALGTSIDGLFNSIGTVLDATATGTGGTDPDDATTGT